VHEHCAGARLPQGRRAPAWAHAASSALGTAQRTPPPLAGLTALSVHSDSTVVVSGAADGSTCLSNIETGRVLGQLVGTLTSPP